MKPNLKLRAVLVLVALVVFNGVGALTGHWSWSGTLLNASVLLVVVGVHTALELRKGAKS